MVRETPIRVNTQHPSSIRSLRKAPRSNQRMVVASIAAIVLAIGLDIMSGLTAPNWGLTACDDLNLKDPRLAIDSHLASISWTARNCLSHHHDVVRGRRLIHSPYPLFIALVHLTP